MFRIVARGGNRIDQGGEKGLQIDAGDRRIQGGGTRPGVGVDDGEVDLVVGRIEIEEEFVGLVDDLGDASIGSVDLVDYQDDGKIQ